MTWEEYNKKLTELRQRAERAVISRGPSLEKLAYQLMVDFVDENFSTRGGRFVIDERVLVALNDFADRYLGAFTESEPYRGAVGQYLKNFDDIQELMERFQRSKGLDLRQARLGAVHEVVVNEILNRYSENGLNPGFVQPMRELLFNNITGGLSKTEAMAQLREFIQGGKDTTGKLQRYLEQTAQQGVDSYTGAVNVRIMQTFDINTMIVSGSLIDTSSVQCRFVINELNGILDREDWPEVEDIAGDELIEGTTFDNLPFNKLHWGCRHEFTPAVLSEAERRNISKPKTNK